MEIRGPHGHHGRLMTQSRIQVKWSSGFKLDENGNSQAGAVINQHRSSLSDSAFVTFKLFCTD
jgi:hypothetical protein